METDSLFYRPDTEAPDDLRLVGDHRAKSILAQTYEQTSDTAERRRVLEWILTVFVHKFSKLSRSLEAYDRAGSSICPGPKLMPLSTCHRKPSELGVGASGLLSFSQD